MTDEDRTLVVLKECGCKIAEYGETSDEHRRDEQNDEIGDLWRRGYTYTITSTEGARAIPWTRAAGICEHDPQLRLKLGLLRIRIVIQRPLHPRYWRWGSFWILANERVRSVAEGRQP